MYPKIIYEENDYFTPPEFFFHLSCDRRRSLVICTSKVQTVDLVMVDDFASANINMLVYKCANYSVISKGLTFLKIFKNLGEIRYKILILSYGIPKAECIQMHI